MSGPGAHSPVGASAVKRALACPASVTLSFGVEDDESDHAALGTATHSLIERCLRTDTDAWQHIGQQFGTFIADRDMANAAQVFVSDFRAAHPDRHQGNTWIERRFHCPTIHELFYGTSDAIHLDMDTWTLHVWDYKNGAGVVVEADHNEQISYYACGALEDLLLWETVERVVCHVVQPNAFHQDGPHRTWETTPDALAEWLEDVLVPGMNRALTSTDVKSGEHCRFCPARARACPALMADMDELEVMVADVQKRGAEALTNDQVGRFLALLDLAKIVGSAANKTAFGRMQAGQTIPGYKLVKAKANREWKPLLTIEGKGEVKLEEAAREAFGAEAFSQPTLLSPAQMDKLPLGAGFTATWAFKPDRGLTVAKDDDQRTGVSTDTKALFQPVQKALPAPDAPPPPVPAIAKRRGKIAA